MGQGTLYRAFDQVSDPRKKRGIRHPFHAILKLVVLGYVSGKVWIEHIATWAESNWGVLKDDLGFTRDYAPDPETIRRAIYALDRSQLEAAFQGWIKDLMNDDQFTAAVDGKAMCKVKGGNGEPAQLLNIFAHQAKLAIAQFPVRGKKGEPTVLRDVLKPLFKQYPGLQLLTGDAAFAGREMCKAITDLGRDYLVQIKGNQPKVKEVMKLHFNEESKKHRPDSTVIDKKKRSNNKTGNLGL